MHPEGHGRAELVADKVYHSTETLVALDAIGVRAYILSRSAAGGGGAATPKPATRSIAMTSHRRRAGPALAAPTRRVPGAAVRASLRDRPPTPRPLRGGTNILKRLVSWDCLDVRRKSPALLESRAELPVGDIGHADITRN